MELEIKNKFGILIIVAAFIQLILNAHALRKIKNKDSAEYETTTGSLILAIIILFSGAYCMLKHTL